MGLKKRIDMRPIKFRAWDRKRKEMHAVDELRWEQGRLDEVTLDDSTAWFDGDGLEMLKIMQYTGHSDKNGKEIFEGDVCRQQIGEHTAIGVMIWNHAKSQFGLDCTVDFEVPEHIEIHVGTKNNHPEIIGNLYENPELVK